MKYIGEYKDSLIISAYGLPFHFYDVELSEFENNLIKQFPYSEIFATTLESSVNHWGYAIIQNGQKIRLRVGDSENEIIEYGEVLDEEKALFSKSKIDSNGNRIYLLDEFPDEEFTEDQVGEEFVFEIFKRFIGEKFDMADDSLF